MNIVDELFSRRNVTSTFESVPVNNEKYIIECKPEIKSPNGQCESHEQSSELLIPIHVHQQDKPIADAPVSLNSQWKLIDHEDEISTSSSEKFYRICPTNTAENDRCNASKIQLISISSSERQMELFQQYTNDDSNLDIHPIIDWQAMFNCLQDYKNKAVEQNQYEQLLWTDVYRPRNSKAYLGNHTKPIRRLTEWFLHWTKKLRNDASKKHPQKGRKRRRDYDDNSDEDFISESNAYYHDRCQSKQEHPQIIFVHGHGTTSLVHALAEEHNFKITEINGSQSRARTSLLKQLEQVTSHHYLSLKRCSSDTIISKEEKVKTSASLPVKKKAKNERGTIMSFFNNKKTDQSDEPKEKKTRSRSKSTKPMKTMTTRRDKEKQMSTSNDNTLTSSVHVEKTSLILFDEIETLTADDNFWSCLKKILETAKKPIILTSNSRSNPDDAIINLSKIGDYEMIHLEPNESRFIHCFLRLILLVEMLEIPFFNDLESICQSCSYDLRRCLLTLQFIAQSSTISSFSTNKIPENKRQPKLQPARIFDTMYYSYLREQWDESILKTYFDDLTTKHTNEYEKSHQLLIDRSKNDSKRIELYDTLQMFMQEQQADNITNRTAFYIDYRPYIRQICESEQIRASESNSRRRLRHCLGFRGCSLQWSDFSILSNGLG